MKVREIKPTSEELRVMLETGFILREAADFEAAARVFQGCIEFMPESEVPLVGLGTVYLQKGDFDAALITCKSAKEVNPTSNYAKVHYAEALLFQKKREEAENELRQIIETSPDSTYSRTAKRLLEAADMITSN